MTKTSAIGLFVPPGHFYSPIVNPDEAESHLDRLDAIGIMPKLAGIEISMLENLATWNSMLPFLRTIPFQDERNERYRYAFHNDHYAIGDGSILHAMIRLKRPKRIVEIGSGWSSACMLDTVEHFLDGKCNLTFIEPHPHLLNSLSGKLNSNVTIIEQTVQSVPLTSFDALKSGDFLFIDSTHVLRTGSDVCFELFEVLPRLARGVIVHFHDIFWPFEYPRIWAVEQNRSWNEIYAIRAFLTNNSNYKILFFNDYFKKFKRSRIENTYPRFLENSGGALWLQKN